jgi:AcrR family transcriptional regulator
MNIKQKIIDSAIENLTKQGLGFSVDSLSKEMKMSKKTIYLYFRSKSELASSIYAHVRQDFDNDLSLLNLTLSCYDYAHYLYLCRQEILKRFSLSQSLVRHTEKDRDEMFTAFANGFLKDKPGDQKTWRLVLESALPQAFLTKNPRKAIGQLSEVLFR